jgi:hypothetical protein
MFIACLFRTQCFSFAIHKVINGIISCNIRTSWLADMKSFSFFLRVVFCHRCGGSSLWISVLRKSGGSWRYLYPFCKLVMRFTKQEGHFLKTCVGDGGMRYYRYTRMCLLARQGLAVWYASWWTLACVRSSSCLASRNVCPLAGWLLLCRVLSLL